MAAAALHCAARRIGGRAFQLPQRNYTAAATDVQGSRVVRPTCSRRSGSSTSSGAENNSTKDTCARSAAKPLGQKSKENLARTQQQEIDNKKEELFHLIAKMDRELPSHCNRDNRQLLMHLSMLVQPKPGDPQWRFYRRALTINTYVFYTLALHLGYLAVSDEISQIYSALVG